jgi:hypothetical protein
MLYIKFLYRFSCMKIWIEHFHPGLKNFEQFYLRYFVRIRWYWRFKFIVEWSHKNQVSWPVSWSPTEWTTDYCWRKSNVTFCVHGFSCRLCSFLINGRENHQNSQTWSTARVFVDPGARPQTSFQLKLLLKESS